MNPVPFLFRLRHQFLWQSRWLALPLILFIVLLPTRHLLRSSGTSRAADPIGFSAWSGLAILALLVAWVVFAAIRWQAPFNSDTATHTRPIGSRVIFISHLFTFLLWIVVPWLIIDMLTLQGYGFTWRSWAGIVVSSVLVSSSFAMLLAALSGLAASRTQFLILAVICAVTVAAWYLFNKPALTYRKTNSFDLVSLQSNLATILPTLGILLASLLSCFFSMVKRSKIAALVVLLLGIAQWPLTQMLWPTKSPPGLNYPKNASHRLIFGEVPAASQGTLRLWPNLHLTGLAPDESASLLAFAPVVKNGPWPASNLSSDYREDESYAGAHSGQIKGDEHFRKIASTSPPGELWRAGSSTKRPTLQALMAAAEDKQSPWRLRVAIHAMHKAAELPTRELLHAQKNFVLREGERLEMGPLQITEGDKYPAQFKIARVPLFAADPKLPMRGLRGRFWRPACWFVFRHAESRESVITSMSNTGVGFNTSENPWLIKSSLMSDFFPPLPHARLEFMGIPEQDWLEATTLEIWYPEERGVIELEISNEQMRKLISEAR